MKKFLLFLLILFFTPLVYAQDFNVSNSDISSPNSSGTGKYTGLEIYNSGTTNVYNIGTRYSGRLSRIIFNLASGGYSDANGFEKGHNYTLSMNMATDDWRNNFGSVSVKCEGSSGTELSNGRVSYISYKKIKFSFTAPSDRFCQFVYIDLKSSNITSTAFTGVSNWNLSSLVITDPAYTSGGGSSGGGSSTPTPTPQPNNQDIIDNANQNTQDIIDNQNDNTQSIINSQNSNSSDIIENNNSNTQSIIDNQNKNTDSTNSLLGSCHKNIFNIYNYETFSSIRYSKSDRYNEFAIVLTANGNYTGGSFPLVYHLQLKPSTTYYFKKGDSTAYTGNLNYYLYRGSASGTLVAYTNGNDNLTFTTPATNYIDYYLQVYVTGTQESGGRVVIQRPMLFEGSDYSGAYIPYNEEKCTSKLDDTNSAINDLNDTMKDSAIDDKTSFFTGFSNDTHGLTGIITLPLSTIQSLTNSSCVSLNIPIPFTSSNVTLPCMTQVYQTYIPTVYSLWQVVTFGIISYFICIDIFKMVKGFKDPNDDKVEVLDL